MIVLGSTGSIGINTLRVAKRFNIKIEALSCNSNYKLLNEQIKEFKPKFVYIKNENLKPLIKHNQIFTGINGIEKMLKASTSKKVINAISSFDGFLPSVYTQKLGKILALANKESLVVGGKFLDTKKIIPIDSEHFGLKFLLSGHKSEANSLIITASGGAIRDIKNFNNLTKKDLLNHPNWKMGEKITIDSSTMINKLFEVLEAYWLYGIKQIDALIEKSSKLHAIVNFKDGSSTAHFANADMILPITYAVMGNFKNKAIQNMDFKNLNFSLEEIDLKKYPIFSLKDEVLKNPDLGAIINIANDILIDLFLKGGVKFFDIYKIILDTIGKIDVVLKEPSEIFLLEKKIREFITKRIKNRC